MPRPASDPSSHGPGRARRGAACAAALLAAGALAAADAGPLGLFGPPGSGPARPGASSPIGVGGRPTEPITMEQFRHRLRALERALAAREADSRRPTGTLRGESGGGAGVVAGGGSWTASPAPGLGRPGTADAGAGPPDDSGPSPGSPGDRRRGLRERSTPGAAPGGGVSGDRRGPSDRSVPGETGEPAPGATDPMAAFRARIEDLESLLDALGRSAAAGSAGRVDFADAGTPGGPAGGRRGATGRTGAAGTSTGRGDAGAQPRDPALSAFRARVRELVRRVGTLGGRAPGAGPGPAPGAGVGDSGPRAGRGRAGSSAPPGPRGAAGVPGADASDPAGFRRRVAALRARVERLASGVGAESGAPPNRGGGGGELDGNPALGVDARRTRWEAAREVLGAFFRAYVEDDQFAADRRLDPAVRPERSVVLNAMNDDHQRESDIQLQVILLNYQLEAARVCTSVEWNRSGVSRATGVTAVQRGYLQACQRRETGWKISTLRGNLPFGLADGELKRQAAAGAPNPDPAHLPGSPEAGGTGPLFVDLDLDPEPAGAGNVAALDLDTGAVRKAVLADPASLVPRPGEDVSVAIDLDQAPGAITVRALGDAAVANCGGGRDLLLRAVREVDPAALGAVADDTAGPVFGLRTDRGAFATLRVGDGATASFFFDTDPVVNPGGTRRCP